MRMMMCGWVWLCRLLPCGRARMGMHACMCAHVCITYMHLAAAREMMLATATARYAGPTPGYFILHLRGSSLLDNMRFFIYWHISVGDH